MMRTISWSLPTTVYWSRDEDPIGWWKVLLESTLERLLFSPLLRARLRLVRDTAAEKDFDIILEHLSSEMQENRNGRKK